MEAQDRGLGFDEVVDTLTDLAKAEIAFRNSFPGGKFDLGKFILAAASQYPNLEEVFNDFDTFADQVSDLNAAETAQVYAQVYTNLTPDEQQRSRILRATRFFGAAWTYILDTISNGKNLLEIGKSVIAKD